MACYCHKDFRGTILATVVTSYSYRQLSLQIELNKHTSRANSAVPSDRIFQNIRIQESEHLLVPWRTQGTLSTGLTLGNPNAFPQWHNQLGREFIQIFFMMQPTNKNLSRMSAQCTALTLRRETLRGYNVTNWGRWIIRQLGVLCWCLAVVTTILETFLKEVVVGWLQCLEWTFS